MLDTTEVLYAAVLFIALGFFTLGALALSNWRAVVRDREAMREDAPPRERYYADMEVKRALMRAAGWWTLFGALLPRLLIEERSVGRSLAIMAIAALAVSIFIYEGYVGRAVRHRMLRSEDQGEWEE